MTRQHGASPWKSFTCHGLVCHYGNKVYYASWGPYSAMLRRTACQSHAIVMKRWLTSFSMTSANEVGWVPLASDGRKADFRQLLIRGASCKLPSVFCREGTGWYVRKAVRISGKTS